MKCKEILVQLFLLLYICSYSQNNSFTINGQITGNDYDRVKIWQPKSDSSFYVNDELVEVTNGKFRIEGYLTHPEMTSLLVFNSDNDIFEPGWFYIDPGTQEIDVVINNDKVTLSSTSKTFNEHYSLFKPSMDSLTRSYREASTALKSIGENPQNQRQLDSLNRIVDIGQLKKSIHLLEFIVDHPNSYVGLTELSNAIGRDNNTSLYELAYSYLGKSLKDTHVGAEILRKLEFSKVLVVGEEFPAFDLLNTKKEQVSLSSSEYGKFTLIDFWFHSCGSCIEQFPYLIDLHNKYSSKGFQIIGITSDYERYQDAWKETIDKHELPWLQLWDFNGLNCRKYFINQFPTNYLLNEKGVIIQKNISYENLESYLTDHLTP